VLGIKGEQAAVGQGREGRVVVIVLLLGGGGAEGDVGGAAGGVLLPRAGQCAGVCGAGFDTSTSFLLKFMFGITFFGFMP
jgi:hypothetical protein